MIKLIVGLGNPGQEYQKTRHNAGFLFLDYLLDRCGGSWSDESKFHGLVASCVIGRHKVILLKPKTFMNRSGLSVAAVARYYKFDVEEILVVHDELDFAAGVVKLKKSGGHAGHNGLRDIIAHFGGNGFFRVRVGIGRPVLGKSVSDYVLSKPSKVENEQILSAFDLLESQMNKLVAGDVASVMNVLN